MILDSSDTWNILDSYFLAGKWKLLSGRGGSNRLACLSLSSIGILEFVKNLFSTLYLFLRCAMVDQRSIRLSYAFRNHRVSLLTTLSKYFIATFRTYVLLLGVVCEMASHTRVLGQLFSGRIILKHIPATHHCIQIKVATRTYLQIKEEAMHLIRRLMALYLHYLLPVFISARFTNSYNFTKYINSSSRTIIAKYSNE